MRSFLQATAVLILLPIGAWAQAEAERFQPVLVADSGGPEAGSTYQLAASPDGRWYASGQNDGYVRIWSALDGSEYRNIRVFDPRAVPTSALHIAVSPDSETLIVLAGDALYLTDVQSGTVKRTIPVGRSSWDIAGNPKQPVIALIDLFGHASVRSLLTGEVLFQTQLAGDEPGTPGGTLLHVRFSADGAQLALTNRTTFELWNWSKGSRLLALDAHALHLRSPDKGVPAPIAAVAAPASAGAHEGYWFSGSSFSPDGRLLALCARDRLYLFSVPSLHQTSNLIIAPGGVPGCLFRTSQQLLLAQQDFALTVLSLDTMRGLSFPSVGFSDYLPLAADGRGILYASGNVYLCDANSLRNINHPGVVARQASSVPPNALHFTADGTRLLWSSWFRPLSSWSLESGEPTDTRLSYSFPPSFAPGGYQFGFASTGLDKIQIFDVALGKELSPLAVPLSNPGATVALSEHAGIVAISNTVHGVSVLSGADRTLIGTLGADHPTAVAVQPDGLLVAVADRQGTAVYSVPEHLRRVAFIARAAVFAVEGSEPLREMEFSQDGQWLAVLDENALSLISTRTWETRTLEGPYNGQCLAFSRDSRRLGYVSYAHGATVVDIASAQTLYQDGSMQHRCPMALSADGTILAVSGPDRVDLLSVPSGELRAALYLVGRGADLDWLVTTPDGLFDGTPRAWKSLAWRLSANTFDRLPVETFFRDYYRPGLLADRLGARPPKAPADLAEIDRRQPTVQLSLTRASKTASNDRKIGLTLAIAEAASEATHPIGSGARDLRLFRNGTLVQTWRGALTSKGVPAATVHVEIPIVAGTNRFSAYAFSDTGIKSADAELNITGADSLRRKGTAYVIAMGINHYAADSPGHPLNLQYAEADAGEFIRQFSAAQRSLDQYDTVRVIRLLGADGTRQNLSAVLATLSGNARDRVAEGPLQAVLSSLAPVQPEDGVFIFYAGHGAAEGRHFYLLPQDYNPDAELSNSVSHAVSELDLSQWLEGIAPERSFLILDACQSGQALESSVPVGPLDATGLAQLAYEKGLYILAASKDSESALEAEHFGGGHGLLTYALVEEGLRDGAAAQEGTLELKHWFLYAGQRVPELQLAQSRERRAVPLSGQLAAIRPVTQHPRLLYRREPEATPFIVARFPDASSRP